MDQTCIDLKIRREDSTERLTCRPMYRDIPDLKYSNHETFGAVDGVQDWVQLSIYPRLFSLHEMETATGNCKYMSRSPYTNAMITDLSPRSFNTELAGHVYPVLKRFGSHSAGCFWFLTVDRL